MSRDRATPPANRHSEVIERSYALQCASKGLQEYAKELRRQSNRAVEQSRQVRADLKLFLSRSRPLALTLVLGIPF